MVNHDLNLTIDKDGKTVARSKNLRGILTYASKHGVDKVNVVKTKHGAAVTVVFKNGAVCRTDFASYSVAVGWFHARRSWDMRAFTQKGFTRFESRTLTKLNPTREMLTDGEIFELDDAIDGRAHPQACDDEPPVPGFYYYTGSPTSPDSELHGPFANVLEAEED